MTDPLLLGNNFVIGGTWGRNNITYSFQNGTIDIQNNDEQNAIRQAFQIWADYANIIFTEIAQNGDIRISWAVGDHGDGAGNSFDGAAPAGRLLAHAFLPDPNNNESLLGDVHFDDDETWTMNERPPFSEQPIDLVTVAAHEIGHALGLGHSNVACALMTAMYTGSHRYLSQDDIDGIQSIYGNRTVIRNAISGCTGDTYLINNLPVGASVFWSSSNTSITTVVNNNNQGIVSWTGGQVGIVGITATITLPCGQTVTEFFDKYYGMPTISGSYFTNGLKQPLRIWFGNPSEDYNNVCNLENTSTNMQVTGATSVTWSRIAASPTNTNWSQSGNNINFNFWAIGQTAVFRIKATNGCGTFSYDFGFKSISCGGGGGCDQFNVSPNPATSSINVIVPNIPAPCDGVSSGTSKTTTQKTITEIRLYDQAGNLKKVQKENKTKQTTLNLTGLKTGVYVVEITDGIYKERHQIIIQQ